MQPIRLPRQFKTPEENKAMRERQERAREAQNNVRRARGLPPISPPVQRIYGGGIAAAGGCAGG